MSTDTMKAVRLHAFGGPEVLSYEHAPVPELRPGEVLVQVHATGVAARFVQNCTLSRSGDERRANIV